MRVFKIGDIVQNKHNQIIAKIIGFHTDDTRYLTEHLFDELGNVYQDNLTHIPTFVEPSSWTLLTDLQIALL